MEYLWILLGALIVLVATLLVVGITMYIFFKIDLSNRRISNDSTFPTIFMLVVFFLSFVLRLVAVASLAAPKLDAGIITALKEGFATLGGLTFEGQSIDYDVSPHLWQFCLYYGSILWLALTFVLVVTLGVNYGLYSRLILIKNKLSLKKKRYFVFSSATEDAFVLANSIYEEYQRDTHKGELAVIIFASNEIDKFDRKDELHRKIKNNRYVYLGFDKKQYDQIGDNTKKQKRISILRLLRIIPKSKVVNPNTEYHVFAMENNERLSGLESHNSDFIFDDIEGLTYVESVLKSPKLLINYYVLSDSYVNYEFYDKVLKIKIGNNVDCQNKFAIKIINESNLTGESLMEKRKNHEIDRIRRSHIINSLRTPVIPEEEKERIIVSEGDPKQNRVVLVLGFGPNGQQALTHLYMDTTYIAKVKPDLKSSEEHYVSDGFTAHVFDRKVSDIAGLFEQTHPSFIVSVREGKYKKDNINLSELIKHYAKAKPDDYKKSDEEFFNEVIDERLKFPRINLYDKNCNDAELLEDIDECTGSDNKNGKWGKVNDIIIALGNDELNIATANAILQDIRQELYEQKNGDDIDKNVNDRLYESPLEIFVNIRNEENIRRLNWNNKIDSVVHRHISVITFGCAEEIFTYDKIINEVDAQKVDAIYNAFAEEDPFDYDIVSKPDKIQETIKNALGEDDKGRVSEEVRRMFSLKTPYNKTSSKYSFKFYQYQGTYLNGCGDKETKEDYSYLAQLEHMRWCRWMFSNGFVYASTQLSPKLDNQVKQYTNAYSRAKNYGKEIVKLHSDLLPYSTTKYELLSRGAEKYDLCTALHCRHILTYLHEKK